MKRSWRQLIWNYLEEIMAIVWLIAIVLVVSGWVSAEEWQQVTAYERSETSTSVTYTRLDNVWVRVDGDPIPPGPGPDLSEVAQKYKQLASGISDQANMVNVATLLRGIGDAAVSGNLQSASPQQIVQILSLSLDNGIPSDKQAQWKPLRDALTADLGELARTGNYTSTSVGRLLVEASKGMSAAAGNPSQAQVIRIVSQAAANGEAIEWDIILKILGCILETDFSQEGAFLRVLRCIVEGL